MRPAVGIVLQVEEMHGLASEISPVGDDQLTYRLSQIRRISNDSDLAPSWVMPNDLVKKIIEALNKKSITPEDELADALEDMARDIALIDPDPQDWAG